jgi:uncharacterized protein (TIGR02147 family)
MIFDFNDYRAYLRDWIAQRPDGGHGVRKKMAAHLSCQSAFVSQVLHGTVHLSIEHANKLNSFLDHDSQEADFFILMVLMQRAGDPQTRDFFARKIDRMVQERLMIKNRVKSKDKTSAEVKARYYSAWYYGAIRVLLTIPEMRKKEALTSRLRLPRETVNEALQFLQTSGLIYEKSGSYYPSETHLHLGADSPTVKNHHLNWRGKAIEAISAPKEHHVHYSSALTLSRKDMAKIRALLVGTIQHVHEIVEPSDPETMTALCLDWFEL